MSKTTQTNLREDTKEQMAYLADRWKMPPKRYFSVLISRLVDDAYRAEKAKENIENIKTGEL